MELLDLAADNIVAVVAAASGIVFGLGVAGYVRVLGRRVRTLEEAEVIAQAPGLGAIPKLRTREIHLYGGMRETVSSAFAAVRERITQAGGAGRIQVILVTSARAQPGKSATAVNLAESYARAGHQVLLLEAELRAPRLHELYGSHGQAGLAALLQGKVSLDQALVATATPGLVCLPAAAIPSNPDHLLIQRLPSALADLRASFPVVVIDGSPVLDWSHHDPVAGMADAVVLVAQSGRTRRDQLGRAALQVRRSGGAIVGVLLTGTE